MIKKKIKDLTKEEAQKICDKHSVCIKCPLDINSSKKCMNTIIQNYKKLFEKEIEVPDND